MNCPLCIDQTLEVTWRNGIELDICPKCRGIWLDRGEIDRLLATEEPDAPPSPRGQPARQAPSTHREDAGARQSRDHRSDDKDGKKRKKKRKSLADRLGDALEEVLDELT